MGNHEKDLSSCDSSSTKSVLLILTLQNSKIQQIEVLVSYPLRWASSRSSEFWGWLYGKIAHPLLRPFSMYCVQRLRQSIFSPCNASEISEGRILSESWQSHIRLWTPQFIEGCCRDTDAQSMMSGTMLVILPFAKGTQKSEQILKS